MAMMQEWVATFTFTEETRAGDRLIEAGGVYTLKPSCKWTEGARRLVDRERVVSCPRCGQRFAETQEGTAEENRDLHFDGDADIPSICAHMPARRLELVSPR
jgi:hypothetical protein